MIIKLFYYIRVFKSILRGFLFFKKFVYIENDVYIYAIDKIRLGKGVKIYRGAVVDARQGEILINDGVTLSEFSRLTARESKIILSTNVFVGQNTYLYAFEENIIVGEDSLIAPFCYINSGNHGFEKSRPINKQRGYGREINIGVDCWIGAHTVVLAGSTIENGCVVGASSLVLKSSITECDKVYVGNPIKYISERK